MGFSSGGRAFGVIRPRVLAVYLAALSASVDTNGGFRFLGTHPGLRTVADAVRSVQVTAPIPPTASSSGGLEEPAGVRVPPDAAPAHDLGAVHPDVLDPRALPDQA